MTRAAHQESNVLRLKRLGIDTYQELVIFMASECPVCRSEGWGAQSRIMVAHNGSSIIATLNVTTGAGYLQENLSFLRGRLLLGAGLRFDEFRYAIADEALETAATKLDQFCALGQWDLNSKFIDCGWNF